VGDIDFANGFVKFTRSSTRGLVGPTKTGRERKIPLTPELSAALKGIRHLRSKLVFCNDDGSALSLDQLRANPCKTKQPNGPSSLKFSGK
jgi:hypothetical protein